jgi:hypothetical protein
VPGNVERVSPAKAVPRPVIRTARPSRSRWGAGSVMAAPLSLAGGCFPLRELAQIYNLDYLVN